MGQNLVPLVNPKIACKWMFIPLKMVSIGIDPYPFWLQGLNLSFANCPIIQFGEANYQNYQKQEPHLKMSSKPITYAVFDQYVD
jgi:hypothetical protein